MIGETVLLEEMQFRSVPDVGTTGAISKVRKLEEQYLGKNRKMYLVFTDPEKDA